MPPFPEQLPVVGALVRYVPSLQRAVAPTGRDSAELTVAFADVAAAATVVRRGGFATRVAGGSAPGSAAEARNAAARVLSARAFGAAGFAISAPGAGFNESGAVGVRCDAGTAAAGRGGGGALGGSLTAGAVAGAGGVG
jgi:hypothetical protein